MIVSDRCGRNEEKNAFVVDVVMSSNLPNPFWNAYLGFGLDFSAHLEGRWAGEGGAWGESGGGASSGEEESGGELHGCRFSSSVLIDEQCRYYENRCDFRLSKLVVFDVALS